LGIDLAAIQPRGYALDTHYDGKKSCETDWSPSHPENLSFCVRDIEQSWDGLGVDGWNIIHMRMLNGSIEDWERTYAEVFRYVTFIKFLANLIVPSGI